MQISPNPNRDLLDAGKWIKDNFHSYTIVACPYPAGLYAAGRTFKYGRLSTNLDNPGLLIWDPNCPPLGVYGLPPSNPLGDLELIKKFRTSAHVYLFTKKNCSNNSK